MDTTGSVCGTDSQRGSPAAGAVLAAALLFALGYAAGRLHRGGVSVVELSNVSSSVIQTGSGRLLIEDNDTLAPAISAGAREARP